MGDISGLLKMASKENLDKLKHEGDVAKTRLENMEKMLIAVCQKLGIEVK